MRCDYCGIEFFPNPATPQQHFCSEQCRINYYNQRCIEERHKRNIAYKCKYCGAEFYSWRKGLKFCTDKCSELFSMHKMDLQSWNEHLKESLSNSDADTRAVLLMEKYNVPYDYVGGYNKATGMVKCRKCGTEFKMSFQNFRHGNHKPCPRCDEIRKSLLIQKRNTEKESLRIEKEKAKSARIEKAISDRESKKRTVVCDMCGKKFETYKQKQKRCSPECTRKYQNWYASKRKDYRITEQNTIDRNITLESLYIRDLGVCYLCGKECDKTANPNSAYYPSIDHVIPLAHGGLEAWSNVRLAHRKCNWEKRDKYVEESTGQLAIFAI